MIKHEIKRKKPRKATKPLRSQHKGCEQMLHQMGTFIFEITASLVKQYNSFPGDVYQISLIDFTYSAQKNSFP